MCRNPFGVSFVPRCVLSGTAWVVAGFVVLLLAMAVNQTTAQPPKSGDQGARKGWILTFGDEFDGSALDRSKWNPNDPWGWERNHELQAYVADAFEVKDGVVRIRADERHATYDRKSRTFSSGMMTSYQKFSQAFGRFEIRCRVPRGKGLWPAFWLLPEPLAWPPEIDVLEILGHDTRTIHFTHHFKESEPGRHSDGGKWESKEDFGEDFHVVAAEWTPREIRWDVDGKERFRSTRTIPQGPMYLLVNLAVGGNWPGSPDEKTVFPAYFEVDYVRVYKRP